MLTGETRTHVRLAGDPSSPALLLIHDGAYGTDAELCWDQVQRSLADDFFVLAPDLIGWGRSDKLVYFDRSPYESRLRQLGDLCRTLCLGDQGIYLVGVSFGAELAVRATIEPAWNIPTLATVSIAGTGGRLYRIDTALADLLEYVPSPESARKVTEWLVADMTGLDDHVRTRYENSLIPGHWESLSSARLHNPAVERPPGDESWMTGLAECTVPMLFVEGREDKLLESGWAAEMAGRVPGSVSQIVDGAHEPNIDRPLELAATIREYFTKVGSGQR
jgi:pimeloyl-ACP methyl ester carboxylesterase